MVILHLKLRKVYVCNALPTTTNISRAWNRVILWMKNEWIYEWMDVLSQKAFRAEGSRVSERWGFLFLTLWQSDLLWGSLRKAKAQCSLGLPSLWSPPKTIAPSCPTTTRIQLIQNCCWPWEKRGNAVPLITPRSERLWRAHTCTAPQSTEGAMEKGKTGWSGSTEHEPPGIFTTLGLRMASEPKEDLV